MPPKYSRRVSQSLSGRDYVLIALVSAVIGAGMLFSLVFLAPRLIPSNLINQFFYIVLLVWGLICAIVTFGVMSGYAHLTYHRLGLALELGGPVVVTFLVVCGGFFLVPRTDTFALTVRPHGSEEPVIGSGVIQIEFGSRKDSEEIHDGEANFKGVPAQYRGAKVRALPIVPGYKEEYQLIEITGDAIDLALTKESAQNTFRGRIVPTPRRGSVVKVVFQGEDGSATPDELGRFNFTVHRKIGERIRVDVCEDGRRVYDSLDFLFNDEVLLHTRKPDTNCSQ